MEDQEDWLVFLGSDCLLDVFLVLAEKLGMESDISWLVHTVDVTKSSSNGEVRRDWREGLVDSQDILGLSVKRVVINILIVDTILFTASNTDLLCIKCQENYYSYTEKQ